MAQAGLLARSTRSLLAQVSGRGAGFHASAACAAKGGKGKKGEVVDDAPKALGYCDLRVATGLNVLKAGKDPELEPSDKYPDWLWTLTDTERTLLSLQQQASADPDSVDEYESSRLMKLMNREHIKATNATKSKK